MEKMPPDGSYVVLWRNLPISPYEYHSNFLQDMTNRYNKNVEKQPEFQDHVWTHALVLKPPTV
jgi:hypothetical protein